MARTETIRSPLHRMVRIVPFRKFVVSLANGDRALVKHPENIAFDPKSKGMDDFYLIAPGKVRLWESLDAITGITVSDRTNANN